MNEEMIDIVDENDNVIDTVPRSVMRKKSLRHRCTYFMVFNSNGELLITKRTKTKDINPGKYEIPGGSAVMGESYIKNVHREIEEELGIKNPDLKFLFDMSYEDKHTKELIKVYTCVYDGDIKPQEEEIDSYFFISIDKLKKMIQENRDKFPKNRIKILEKYLGEKII